MSSKAMGLGWYMALKTAELNYRRKWSLPAEKSSGSGVGPKKGARKWKGIGWRRGHSSLRYSLSMYSKLVAHAHTVHVISSSKLSSHDTKTAGHVARSGCVCRSQQAVRGQEGCCAQIEKGNLGAMKTTSFLLSCWNSGDTERDIREPLGSQGKFAL